MKDLQEKIIRLKRRSIALAITQEGELQIRSPLKASLQSIKNFVDKNQEWIEKKIAEKRASINKYHNCIFPREFISGAKIMYAGKTYVLHIGNYENIKVADYFCLPERFLPKIKQRIVIWLKHQSYKKIIERVNYFSEITGLRCTNVKITSAKGIWGSCNFKGSLIINWRLVMVPPEVLDYIIVHELAHLVVRNHTKRFWTKVETILPDYKKCELWLRENSEVMML